MPRITRTPVLPAPASPQPGSPSRPAPAGRAGAPTAVASFEAGPVRKGKALDPAVLGKQVLAKLALQDDPYTHYEERVAKRVGQLSEQLVSAANLALAGGGPIQELKGRFPSASFELAMAASCFEHESIQYLVSVPGEKKPHRFVQLPSGKLVEDRESSDALLGKISLKGSKGSFRPLAYRRQVPVFSAPPFAPGREVDVASRSSVRAGRLVGATPDGKWTLELTTSSGEKSRKTLDAFEVLLTNSPHEFKLHGCTYSDVELNVDKDPTLKKFLDGAIAIAKPLLDAAGPDTASQVAAQKQAIQALLPHVAAHLEYPSTPQYGAGTIPPGDSRSVRFNELMEKTEREWGGTVPFGELLDIRAGMCRHRAIAMQLCLQVAGIDSRLTSGGAYTQEGVFRGPHAWLETTLADGSRYLTDPQWGDAFLPLRETYETDARRAESVEKTAHYDGSLIL